MSEKPFPVLFDTDVLIWYFRGMEAAAVLIEQTPFEQRFVSSVCMMELIQGCRNRKELKYVMGFVEQSFFRTVHCDKAVSEKAIALLRRFALSHGLRTVDALIAATVIVNKASLVTANHRHFKMIEDMRLVAFNPGTKG